MPKANATCPSGSHQSVGDTSSRVGQAGSGQASLLCPRPPPRGHRPPPSSPSAHAPPHSDLTPAPDTPASVTRGLAAAHAAAHRGSFHVRFCPDVGFERHLSLASRSLQAPGPPDPPGCPGPRPASLVPARLSEKPATPREATGPSTEAPGWPHGKTTAPWRPDSDRGGRRKTSEEANSACETGRSSTGAWNQLPLA